MTRGKTVTVAALSILLFLLAGAPAEAGGKQVKVVATLPNLGSIAAAIGGDRIRLTVIAVGTQDAHFVDPKPSSMVKLRSADLLLVNGLDLEIGWVPPLTQGSRNPKILRGAPGYIDCSAGIPVVEVPTVLSRAEGDVHPYGNPHYLTDPLNAIIVAGTITDALKGVDPEGAAAYEEGRKTFVHRLLVAMFGDELVDLVGGSKLAREAATGHLDAFLGTSYDGAPLSSRLGGWLGKMAPVRGKPVITYHRDYSYFASRFGLDVVAYVEPKPGITPSAKHLEELVQLIQAGTARVIIARPYQEHRSTDLLGERAGAVTITLPLEVGGARGVDDYFQLYDFVTDQIVSTFAGLDAPAGS
ncbi:MAG: metal ABC transporter substrate-binding protein [Acidobacteriota bacterium]|jgi:ABC-type Zn uptake system ZnuABC Zn-binding protein ZnuA